jgi:hypothetical protein
MKVPFGLKDNRLWFVTDVPNGNGCECVCPKCKQPLQARNNPSNIKQPYFAHVAHATCTYSGMTDVHLMAQQILVENGLIETPVFREIPSLRLKNGETIYGNEIFIESAEIQADSVFREFSRNGFVADIAFDIAGKYLLIEVAVTHFVEREKLQKARNSNAAMIEIDLSNLDSKEAFDKAKFTQTVLHPGDLATWINNPKANVLRRAALEKLKIEQTRSNKLFQAEEAKERKVQEEKQRKLDSITKRRTEERNKISGDLELLEESNSKSWRTQREEVFEISLNDWKLVLGCQSRINIQIVDVEVKGDWIINTHRVNWQSYIVGRLLEGSIEKQWSVNDLKKLVVKRFGILDFMERLNLLKQQQKQIGRKRDKAYQDYGCWFLDQNENATILSPFLPVVKYVEHLRLIRVVELDESVCSARFSTLNQYEEWEGVRRELEEERKRRDLTRPPFVEEQVPQLVVEEKDSQSFLEEQERQFRFRQQNRDQQKLAIQERAEILMAADERLLKEGAGDGFQCLQCRMSYLMTDELCPFCGSSDRNERQMTTSEFRIVGHKLRSGTSPRISVVNFPSLPTKLLSKYLRTVPTD